MKNCFFALILVFFLSYCTSVQKHNAFLNQNISVEKQLEDIDFLKKKIKKIQPSLYLYISKEDLDKKFDSLRKTVDKPLTPNVFYLKISPLLAAIRQGHSSMDFLRLRFTKKQRKELEKKGIGPVSQLQYKWLNGKLVVLKNNSKNTGIKPGSEVVSIDTILPQNLFKKYRPTYTSDGFNQSFIPIVFEWRFSSYMFQEIGLRDSLNFKFKFKDSIYTQYIKRKAPKKEKKGEIKKDAIAKKAVKDSLVKKLTPAELKLAKVKKKSEEKFKRNYGYDATTKTYAKTLTFTTADSTTAHFKIKNFTQGKYKTIYKEVFALLDKKKTKNLILDLRNNPGGRLDEIHNLYSYLTADSTYQLIEDFKVVSKGSLLHIDVPKIVYPFAIPLYPVLATVAYLKTTKDANGDYRIKTKESKSKPHNPNYFKGKIYVLINGGSFSAPCILSSKLKENKNITFVGQETGGAFNGTVAGMSSSAILPNSKLPIKLWIMDVIPTYKTPILGRGIFPDIEIIPTLEDLIFKKDPELDWVKNAVLKR